MQILLVEDDRALANGLKTALHKQGYAINHVETGKAGLHVVKTDPPDIVILDLGLPDIDGIAVLTELRKFQSELPVLLLTARAGVEDKIIGLDSGADDYLAKPFEMSELLARLRVVERRLSSVHSNLIEIGKVSLDTSSHGVNFDGSNIELSRKEYMLLKNLMENSGRVLTRATLETRLYEWGEEVTSNALEVHIHHLRKKFGTEFIKTVRGVGYKVDKV